MLTCELSILQVQTSPLTAVGISCDALALSTSALGHELMAPHVPFLARIVLFLANFLWDELVLLWWGHWKR